MKYDEFHRLIVKNGWISIRQAGSHVIYRKGQRGLTRFHIIREKNWAKGWKRKSEKKCIWYDNN